MSHYPPHSPQPHPPHPQWPNAVAPDGRSPGGPPGGAVHAGPLPGSGVPAGRPPRGRRLLAWLVDFAAVVVVAVLLGVLTFHRISGEVTGLGLAGQSVWHVLGSHGDLPGAAEDIGLTLWNRAVNDVEQAFAVLTVFAFGYQFVTLLLLRRTVGKALLGLRVVPKGPGVPGPLGRRRAAVRAAVTAVADVGCYALACCLLLEGDFLLAWSCWLLSAAVFVLNATPTLLGTGRSLADRFAGTAVTSVHLRQHVAHAAGMGRAAVTRAAGRLRRPETQPGSQSPQ